MTNQRGVQPPGTIALTAEYSTPYGTIVRDNIVMGVPRYFLERWVPVLGPHAATLVNTLRQLSYRGQSDTITISGLTLAREASMSRRHLYTCLDTPWINAFVRTQPGQRTRSEQGQLAQQANQYHVRIDDPLTPADAAKLVDMLRTLADTPIEAARRALDYSPRELWATTFESFPESFSEPRPLLALDALKRAFPTWQSAHQEEQKAYALAAEQLHRHVTMVNDEGRASKVIVPQYFRRNWWSRLGNDLAWIYLWLRGQVYDNASEGIQRDVCWVDSLNTLLALIGRTREWWRRNVENAAPPSEPWSLTDFFEQITTQKGRDGSHPQWVARQFRVALTIPIAPNDHDRYSKLLKAWPPTVIEVASPSDAQQKLDQEKAKITTASATIEHTVSQDVSHEPTHRLSRSLPQSNTPDKPRSATNEHTGTYEVCHICAQRSATPVHRELESLVQGQKGNTQATSISKHSDSRLNSQAAAADNTNLSNEPQFLVDQLAQTLETTPETPLYLAATTTMWLHQAWSEPIRPHTPLWTMVIADRISPRDLIALMLAVWADSAIKHPPRYLSWLAQRWQAAPDLPPVDHWSGWLSLAELPIRDWFTIGRQRWIELASREKRDLPFGLDVLWGEIEAVENSQVEMPLPDPAQVPNGLDVCPGTGRLSILDIWRATLGQLSVQLNRSTYVNWVEGARAVCYADGVLTVRARHPLARDWLAQRLNYSIEETASFLAQTPIKICYTADS